LDDCLESELLDVHAPVLQLNPRSADRFRPANVDWYLRRVGLLFHHNNCPDDEVAPSGSLTQHRLLTFRVGKRAGLPFCRNTGSFVRTEGGPWDQDEHFVLSPDQPSVREGSDDPADWIVYGHAYLNAINGVNLQYWFFYPFNDNLGSFNHEGDWESMTVRLRHDRSVDRVFFCQHGNCDISRRPDQMAWVGGHPVGFVADGSHATYPSAEDCNDAPVSAEAGGPNCVSADTQSLRWFTWRGGARGRVGLQGGGVVNVGERGAPLNGQLFIDYVGIWGERGETKVTSGPRTPSQQASWNLDRLGAGAS